MLHYYDEGFAVNGHDTADLVIKFELLDRLVAEQEYYNDPQHVAYHLCITGDQARDVVAWVNTWDTN